MAEIRKALEKIAPVAGRYQYTNIVKDYGLFDKLTDSPRWLANAKEEKLRQIIEDLVERTRKVESEIEPAYYKQLLNKWHSQPAIIQEIVREIAPDFLAPHTMTEAMDDTRTKSMHPEAATIPEAAKPLPTTQENRRNNKFFNKVGNALQNIAEILSYGNASNKSYYGSCGGFGVQDAHGLFGRRDETGHAIWDKLLCRKKEHEEEKMRRSRDFNNYFHLFNGKLIYERDSGTVIVRPFYNRYKGSMELADYGSRNCMDNPSSPENS